MCTLWEFNYSFPLVWSFKMCVVAVLMNLLIMYQLIIRNIFLLINNRFILLTVMQTVPQFRYNLTTCVTIYHYVKIILFSLVFCVRRIVVICCMIYVQVKGHVCLWVGICVHAYLVLMVLMLVKLVQIRILIFLVSVIFV